MGVKEASYRYFNIKYTDKTKLRHVYESRLYLAEPTESQNFLIL